LGRRKIRRLLQVSFALAGNGYLPGWLSGRIYTGALKSACLPGLNCYSCPGSFGSCPVGSLQAVLGSRQYDFSFYLLGFLVVTGTVLGRFVCGALCPFGLIQELLHKIPLRRKIKTFRLDRPLRGVKYLMLALFAVLLPLVLSDAAGNGVPAFCKWICPAGTLEAGVPLVLYSPVLRPALGLLYCWKVLILAAVILASVVIPRPFCRYLCPLGAVYAMFNRISVLRYAFDPHRCTGCGACERACPMAISPTVNCNGAECVRCGECRNVCPAGAIGMADILPEQAQESD